MVGVSFLQSELGFSDSDKCVQFLREKGAVFNADSTKLDCKLSAAALQAVWGLSFKNISGHEVLIQDGSLQAPV